MNENKKALTPNNNNNNDAQKFEFVLFFTPEEIVSVRAV